MLIIWLLPPLRADASVFGLRGRLIQFLRAVALAVDLASAYGCFGLRSRLLSRFNDIAIVYNLTDPVSKSLHIVFEDIVSNVS